MAAYVIAEVSVTDPDVYENYKPLAGASVAEMVLPSDKAVALSKFSNRNW